MNVKKLARELTRTEVVDLVAHYMVKECEAIEKRDPKQGSDDEFKSRVRLFMHESSFVDEVEAAINDV